MINAIYLAAGKSSRMGRHKLSLELGDSTVGNLALSVLMQSSYINEVFVIVQEDDSLHWISKENKEWLKGKKGQILVCKESFNGQSFSLKRGFSIAVKRPEQKILICLADQPFINEKMIETLYSAEMEEGDEYIASVHKGVIKPPILFHKKAYEKIEKLAGDTGARSLIKKGNLQGKKIEFSEDDWFVDIDTEEDYLKWK
ncbi:MAG TPA: NTP transferase domain-containing protein [Niallia sp.]|nr:NTP transferase domain-containing protein [Niallia sp.]